MFPSAVCTAGELEWRIVDAMSDREVSGRTGEPAPVVRRATEGDRLVSRPSQRHDVAVVVASSALHRLVAGPDLRLLLL